MIPDQFRKSLESFLRDCLAGEIAKLIGADGFERPLLVSLADHCGTSTIARLGENWALTEVSSNFTPGPRWPFEYPFSVAIIDSNNRGAEFVFHLAQALRGRGNGPAVRN